MINDDSVRAVAAATWTEQFIRPLYGSYCFAHLPRFIQSLFGITGDRGLPPAVLAPGMDTFDRVVLFLVDGFGWRFFGPRQDHYPALTRIGRDGVVSILTSQFPSTTTAHVTTLYTGLPVGQSGLYEWFYYEPQLDAVIAPLLFSFAGDLERDTLRDVTAPEAIYPRQAFAVGLQSQGITTFQLQHRSYTASTYTTAMSRGARVLPYDTVQQAMQTVTDLLEQRQGRMYVVLYVDRIDSISHHYGPDSQRTNEEIDTFLGSLERVFLSQVAGKHPRTLFVMTADHGHTAIDPATTIYLNRVLPELGDYLRASAAGRPLVPAGSARDMFLYVKAEHLDEAQSTLVDRLQGRADVHRVDDLIAQGFFGPEAPSEAFRQRVGNLVVLPYASESVWWYERGRFQQEFYGHHGGLTRDEMEIPLLVLDLS